NSGTRQTCRATQAIASATPDGSPVYACGSEFSSYQPDTKRPYRDHDQVRIDNRACRLSRNRVRGRWSRWLPRRRNESPRRGYPINGQPPHGRPLYGWTLNEWHARPTERVSAG